MFKRKLHALDYPDWATANLDDKSQFRTLVVWLEETQIRFHPEEKRKPLRAIQSGSWDADFVQYVKDMECPHQVDRLQGESKSIVTDWLLGVAVGAAFHDDLTSYNGVAKSEAVGKPIIENKPPTKPNNAWGTSKVVGGKPAQANVPAKKTPTKPATQTKPTTQDKTLAIEDKADFLSAVNELAAVVKIAPIQQIGDAPAIIRTIASRVQQAKKTSLPQKGGSLDTTPKNEQAAFAALDALELGFSTNNKILDRAAKVLRLLHLHNLRNLQTMINEVIVTVQDFTADPKTDSRLGQVGRG